MTSHGSHDAMYVLFTCVVAVSVLTVRDFFQCCRCCPSTCAFAVDLCRVRDCFWGRCVLQRGADADCPHAHVALAHMYSHGKGGCEQDFTRAFEHHRKAADAGLALAQYNLATQYFAGKGVASDMAKAVHYYDLAAEQGFIYAQINLGNMYNTGFGVDEDLLKAREYYAMAAPYSADARGLLEGVEEKIRDADRLEIDDDAIDASKITADNIQSADTDTKK
eukprot:m.1558753 g.1558753  ORF g.1558753 m.1558753 type:complete len:221 (-) comp25273_c0_seq77:7011-7673(-)